jgi:hypothetical protein
MGGDKKLKLNLLENARSSLQHAVFHLSENDKLTVDDYKYAILDIVHAIELLFKEKLQRVHPAFMWKNVDKYPSREAESVTIDEAKQRLIRIAKINFTEKHLDGIHLIRRIRNEIEHYEFEIDEPLAKTHIGRMLSFIIWFSSEYLELEWETGFKREDSWSALINMYQFFEEHVEIVENRMSKEQRYVEECPACGAYTFDMETEKCKMCSCSAPVFQCEKCGELCFDKSRSEIIEGWCKQCEDKDEEASANFERY